MQEIDPLALSYETLPYKGPQWISLLMSQLEAIVKDWRVGLSSSWSSD